ncbi:MAG: HAD hydrolase-like protein, partial [Oscillospiraceae bacterium]|nr:HAD hydrolase-like protein [Oscillospiraceae bacterium]
YGITITKSYRCPHLQDGNPPYNISCSCRKPNTGMFEQAIKDHGLDPSLCIACGDKLRDVERLPDIGVPKENTGVIDGVEFHSILDFYKKVTAAE